MDPITIIVSALASGAAAGLKPTAEKAIKDAYEGIKSFITQKYTEVDLAPLERKPDSEMKRNSIAEDLTDSGATDDLELLSQAKALLDAIEQHDNAAATAIGIDLEEVKAAFFRIQEVRSTGTGVRVKKGEFSGGIDIGSVVAGQAQDKPNPTEQ